MTPPEIVDREEIQALLMRYAAAVDGRDWELYRSVFTADAIIDYTSAGGIRGGLDEVTEWMRTVMERFVVSQHPTWLVELSVDGDVAVGRSCFFNPMGWLDAEGRQRMFFVGGWYRDRFVRTGGTWRIAERTEEAAWFHGDLPPGGGA
ncbi:MAG: hypothetical protein C4321_06495 [Chloroflexota bacterium]